MDQIKQNYKYSEKYKTEEKFAEYLTKIKFKNIVKKLNILLNV